jgi:dihydroflavonol-4-reductase
MKVLVTGGTGFVGSHSVKALLDAGHDVRLLVRSPERIAAALGPLGVATPEHVAGDVTDAAAVRRALEGCDAALHAANVFSYDSRGVATMQQVNRDGTELVLKTANELGLDPIVHVSSFVALLPGTPPLRPDSPVGDAPVPYARSKADGERIARDLQRAGAPVVRVLPGMVWGPHDPHMGEGAMLARDILRGVTPARLPGGAPVVDVRDVAAVHAAVMEPDRGPRAYLVTGEYAPFARIGNALRAATGRRLPSPPIPAPALLAVARAADVVQRLVPFRLPVHHEPPWTLVNGLPGDDSGTRQELGVTFRAPEESIADTVRWLYETGRIGRRAAGRAAS